MKAGRRVVLVLMVILLLSGTSSQVGADLGQADDSVSVQNGIDSLTQERSREPYYADVKEAWEHAGYSGGQHALQVSGADVSARSSEGEGVVESYGGKSEVLIWHNARSGWIEYEVQVPTAGLYAMRMTYQAYNDPQATYQNYRPTTLAVSIDGQYPFREARAIGFPRWFSDELPLKQDAEGNDVRPKPLERLEWRTQYFRDAEGIYDQPLLWALDAGKTTIRLQGMAALAIDTLELVPPHDVLDYTEYLALHPPLAPVDGEILVIEAEDMHAKNDVSIQMAVDQDPWMTPDAANKLIFNAVGGTRWQRGGAAIEWTVDVPQDGYYQLALRAYQGYQSNKKVFRQLWIDGELPFAEMQRIAIPYASQWQGVLLGNEQGEGYRYYLTSGRHTLTLTSSYAPYQPVLRSQSEVLQGIRELSEDIQMITGGVDDLNRTWDIVNLFPELPAQVQTIRDQTAHMQDMLVAVNGQVDMNAQALATSVKDLEDLLIYPNDLPYKREELSLIASRIASISEQLTQAPLLLDKLYLIPEGAELPRMQAKWGEKAMRSISSFLHSFSDEGRLRYDDEDVLHVWVNYGRDYVNLVQEMADQVFTPMSGIVVKVDLLPDENLLVLANAAGRSPDVALGVTEGRPIELAIRNAAEDLSVYPQFEDVMAQFSPGAMLPYAYNGGTFALPETQRFSVLFYRKDVLQRLGLDVPDTWQDVLTMLPTLQQNGFNFHIPYNDYLTFLYQHGAEFYTEDGMQTALDTPEAFKGFKMLTELFTIYGIERQVPSFYQRFRDGDMPIGIADFNFYLQMRVAAPELEGWWGMAPMPGVRQADGEVARWTGGNQTAAMMFNKTAHKEEAWSFIKWWVSAETQQRFGNDLEGFYGVAFRWNTANLEAFTQLPWNEEELQAMLEQWRWYKEMANIPGSYFIPRELLNAWNRTVLSGQNYRDALEEAVMGINRELWRKANEFRFIDEQGQAVRTYDPPQVTEPWKGVERYIQP